MWTISILPGRLLHSTGWSRGLDQEVINRGDKGEMPPDPGPSLDMRQQAKSQFLGTSWKGAVPPLHQLFSPWMQLCITCPSAAPGVLKQSLSIQLPIKSQVMPTGFRFQVQGGSPTYRPWGALRCGLLPVLPPLSSAPQHPGHLCLRDRPCQIPECCCRPRSWGFPAKPKLNSFPVSQDFSSVLLKESSV